MKIKLIDFQKTGGWTPGSYQTKKEIYLEPDTLVSYPLASVVSGDYIIVKCVGEDMPPHFGVYDPEHREPYFGYYFISSGIYPEQQSGGLAEPVEGFPDYYKITVLFARDNVAIVLYSFANEPPRLYSDAVYFNQMPSKIPGWLLPVGLGGVSLAAIAIAVRRK